MDNLEESLISLDADIPPVDKPSEESSPSLDTISDVKAEEVKHEESLNPIALVGSEEPISDVDKTSSIIEIGNENDAVKEENNTSSIDISDRIKEAKSNLSEFLKVEDDPPQNAVLNEFEEGLESARERIIEDLMSNTETTPKDELLTYTAHFDVLNANNTEVKLDNEDANTEEVNMDIDTSLKNESAELEKVAEDNDKSAATFEMNVEDKIKELLVLENDEEEKIISPPTLVESKNSNAAPEEVEKETESDKLPTVTSKDDIDTLLSTLMPDLESSTKPEDIAIMKKPAGAASIQYLRDVLDKPDERGTKRKISTDSESDEKSPKKAKVLPNLPEVTLTKVGSTKKRRMNFDDLMSNLTKIKLPSSSWKVKISAGSNPFSIVEFHEKEKLLRSVKFLKEDFQHKISFNNLPVELLGAPQDVQSLDDVSVLLSIVNTLVKHDPVVHYL